MITLLRRESFGGIAADTTSGRYRVLDHAAYEAALALPRGAGQRNVDVGRQGYELPRDALASPIQAYLEVTLECNARCGHCYARRDAGPELGGQQLAEVVDQLAEVGCFRLRLTGGEPTLRPDLPALIRQAHSAGMVTELNTNGLMSSRTLARLLDAGLRDIRLSLDGPQPVHDGIRGEGAYRRATTTLAALAEHNAGTTRPLGVTINVVLMQRTRGVIRPMAELAHGLGFWLSFGLLRGSGAQVRREMLSPSQVLEAAREVESLRQELGLSGGQLRINYDVFCEGASAPQDPYPMDGSRCPAGTVGMGIDVGGRVSACNFLLAVDDGRWVGQSVLGGELLAVWHRSALLASIRQVRRAGCDGCALHRHRCNGGCPASAVMSCGELDGPDPYCVWPVYQQRGGAAQEGQ